MMLQVKDISVSLGGRSIVHNVSFSVEAGEKLMIVGPNGAGKTTLIRAVMQAVPHSGQAVLLGRNISTYRSEELARHIGVLTQNHYPQFAYSVQDVVSLGRYPYRKGIFASLTKEDDECISHAMMLTGVDSLADASIQTLSGGELQRVFLAQLFAQDPDVLILDEPTNNLDLAYQISIFDIINEWVRNNNKAVIAVIHDLNMVYKYASKALLMNAGQCAAYGSPEDALSPDNLYHVYNVDIAGWMKGLMKHWEGKPADSGG